MRLATANLANPDDAERLYRFAVLCRCCVDSEQNRIRVFAVAALDVRLCRKPFYFDSRTNQKRKRVPGAIFREAVPKQRWWYSAADEQEALRMISIVNASDPSRMKGSIEDKSAAIYRVLEQRKQSASPSA